MALRSIMLEMGANIARLRSDMEKAGNTLRKFQRDTERIFKTIGTITGAFFAYKAVTTGSRVLISAIEDVTKAAAEEELAQKKLATALGFTSQELLDQASALQQQTAYADDAINSVQAMIATVIKDEDQIKRLTEVTLDFATAHNMDLEPAVMKVVSAIGKGGAELSKYGIVLQDAGHGMKDMKSAAQNAEVIIK